MSATELQQLTGWELSRVVAERVMGLPGVGWYRRISSWSFGWERCEAGDVTPDEPTWKAMLCYCPKDEGDPLVLPAYHSDIGAAWDVMMAAQEWSDDRQIRFTGFLMGCVERDEFTVTAKRLVEILAPENICRAALRAIG